MSKCELIWTVYILKKKGSIMGYLLVSQENSNLNKYGVNFYKWHKHKIAYMTLKYVYKMSQIMTNDGYFSRHKIYSKFIKLFLTFVVEKNRHSSLPNTLPSPSNCY